MSLTADHLQQALDAIAEDDLPRLQRLVRQPVSTQRNQLDRLMRLVRAAAAQGQGEAIAHLLALAPTLEQRGSAPTSDIPTLTDAWVAAHEAGQTTLAQSLVERLPTGTGYDWEDILIDRFLRARKARAWAAMTAVLDQGYRPDVEPLWQACGVLDQEQEQGERPQEARQLLRRLIDLAPAPALAWVAKTAILLGDDDAYRTCLAMAGDDKVKSQLDSLLQTMVQADRADLAHELMVQHNRHGSPYMWVSKAVAPALTQSRIAFVHTLLDRHPEIPAYLHADRSVAGNMGWLLVHSCCDNRTIDVTMDEAAWQRLLARMCPGEQALDVRQVIEQNFQDAEHADTLMAHLNLLALWAAPKVRDPWFEREPALFAEAMAAVRAEQAMDASPLSDTGALKRARVRV